MIANIQALNLDDKKRVYVEVDAQIATVGFKVHDKEGNVLFNFFVPREKLESALCVTQIEGVMQTLPGQKGLNETVHARQLTHDFLKLPHHERVNIMVEYGYLKTPDTSRDIKDDELNKEFFTYVAESGRVLDLQKTIDLKMTERKER